MAIVTRRIARRPLIWRTRAVFVNKRHRYGLVDTAWLPLLTHTELKVLTALAAHADLDRGTCWPSKTTIARHTGLGDMAQIRRALKSLEKKGAVHRQARIGTTTLYWLKPPPDNEDVFQSFPKFEVLNGMGKTASG